ncbi:DNA-directed RNA polymerase subunit beta [endosymbiont of Sipalinus gigas]|uniref:DNA-directed RNA polymerase subunit beta n=1 Tax=endosymbiont of Sipalinus gigas TaxID=1972134 RepID=UPI000DC70450|nr:DNA-directed RNA polymerase subunit beta [endosymbiont of Sipalinus gigas]BBA85271.1 DNA-directed RNA polymerase subunit beta [endosymbiont of Sipalinus gigas]
MVYLYNIKRIRKNFSKFTKILDVPNLLYIQKESFKKFIDFNYKNNNYGINSVLKSFFPIINYNKSIELKYIDYKLDEPIFNIIECKIKGLTFLSQLKIKLNLINYEINSNKVIDSKFQEVYICDIPIMTENGSFIINGTERVIVSQLHRSPGVFFNKIKDKNQLNKVLYNARIIPYRGSWLDFEFDIKDNLFFRIDRKKKLPVTILLHALKFSNENIINLFEKKININIINSSYIEIDIIYEDILNEILPFDIIYEDSIFFKKGKNILLNNIEELKKKNIIKTKLNIDFILNKISYKNYYDKYGNIIILANQIIDKLNIDILIKENINIIEIIFNDKSKNYISNTLNIDNTFDEISAIKEIYKIIKPGELSTDDSIKKSFKNIFFSKDKYNLSEVGRMKINMSLNRNNKEGEKIIDKKDIIDIIKKLINIKNGKDFLDDIDSLSNRRVRLVGEMIENQFRIGISRLEKIIKEKISLISNIDLINPQDIINSKPISSIIKEFFTSSQLSQFMDQNNPLSEITHKRRISTLGPGGLTKERASFEIRDVHPTYYGKLCPIETPEGPNIGLINSLSIYARTNEYGFLETPYKIVKNGLVTNNIIYLSSIEEYNFKIAQADTKLDINNNIIDNYIICRNKGEFNYFYKKEIDYIDISNQQIVSVGASLIPFLEHDDANRALMGANMQRQAVPIIKPEYPIIGTGMERIVAEDSGAIILANRSGIVSYLDSKYIFINVDKSEIYNNDDLGIDIYELNKFSKTNQNTCINQTPCIELNSKVKFGDVIADNQSTNLGELSLGQNLRVAFMIWNGYNFEDSILISERLVNKNKFTSIHIQELICTVRDTRLGNEEITSDIPNIDYKLLSKLDENGIISIGSYVSEGDILVGKITPKDETQLSPEEKLLKAIFGDKASNIKDTSLRVPNGMYGTVIDVQIFFKNNLKKNNSILDQEKNKIKEDINNKTKILKLLLLKKINKILKYSNYDEITNINKKINININDIKNKIYLELLINKFNNLENENNKYIELEYKKINKSNELSPGILKIVKIYIATKKQIQLGDKMSGRHGNKGVVSKICPIEDMPYDINGNVVDIVLNPLGVPSRMNIGQILEVYLGNAAKEIGNIIKKLINNNEEIYKIRNYLKNVYNLNNNINNIDLDKFSDEEILLLSNNLIEGLPISTPVFDGAKEEEIKEILKFANINESGQIDLFDGCTGEKFDRKITVGYMYVMKLNHLVDDKIHARSTGSYSLITQQPLGGKSQFGGQRFGEMEVWALEAYGAAYTLQEMLTVKSDDINGRTNIYKNIINGKYYMEPYIPESFNVLLKEIKSLCIDIELKNDEE